MLEITDQIGQNLAFEKSPSRIVSLVPSITELLIDLGFAENLIGRTKFCIYPKDKVSAIKRIGGTKNPHLDEIANLNPDIVFANKEENIKEHIEQLSLQSPCYVSDIKNIDDALKMIADIGTILDCEEQSLNLINEINSLRHTDINRAKPKAIYLIWNKPYMSVGADTYIHSFLNEIGYQNALPAELTRYPSLSIEEIKRLAPDKLLLSDEPFPFNESHRKELQNELPSVEVELINGSYCSWYGSRILKALKFFQQQNT